MADHVFIQVRDEFIDRLKAGVTAVSNRVYTFDQEPVDESKCPYLIVEISDDQAQPDAIGGAADDPPSLLELVQVRVGVHCVVSVNTDPEKAAYALRATVETTLLGSRNALSLGGKVLRVRRTGGDNGVQAMGETVAYRASAEFIVDIYKLERLADSFTY